MVQPTYAEAIKIALLIGNSNYQEENCKEKMCQSIINNAECPCQIDLPNASNDVINMYFALKNLNFKVNYLENIEKSRMEKAFKAFGEQLRNADPEK